MHYGDFKAYGQYASCFNIEITGISRYYTVTKYKIAVASAPTIATTTVTITEKDGFAREIVLSERLSINSGKYDQSLKLP